MSIKRKKETNEKTALFNWLRNKLRRVSYQWPPRQKAKQLAKVDRGQYKCAQCEREGKTQSHHHSEIVIDHIDPIVNPETGFVSFDEFIMKLFCPVNGFQILCLLHHQEKTQKENEIRRKIKNEKTV